MSNTDYTNIKSIGTLFRRLASLDYIHPDDIPSIDLYMDQVTTFMDDHLRSSKRFEEDKILTKTMINNYAKNNLLPPPVKKKYSQDHMLLLLFIYYLKNIMSISDIQKFLNPITEQYFNGKGEIPLSDIYLEILNFLKQEQNDLFQVVKKEFRASEKLFADAPEDMPREKKEELRKFAFICYLAFDVYLKKLMIETLLDDSSEKEEQAKHSKEKETTAKHKTTRKDTGKTV